jgi:capsular polysaccharide export protein
MTKRLILHVGQSKTGTSTIQDFLAHNRRQLAREARILYPQAGRQGAAHHRIAALFLPAGNAAWIRREDGTSLQAGLEEEVAGVSADTVVISSEALFNARSIEDVQAFFAGYAVEILVILRRQDRWLDSLYQHQLKVGETDLEPQAWLAARVSTLDYAARVGRWADVFGDASLRIGVFEPANLAAGLMAFFFRTAGLPVPPGLAEPPARNERLSRDALAYLRRTPRQQMTAPERQRLRRALEEWSQANPDPPAWRYFFSPSERADILARSAASNAAVARRFLPESGGVLFRDTAVEAGFEPYPGLAPEVAASIERAVAATTAG